MPKNLDARPAPPQIAGLILAAGCSTRTGESNKLLAELGGIPVVTWVTTALVSSHAKPVILITGHEAAQVKHALADYAVNFVHNPDYADGMSTSLRRGIAALPHQVDGVLVCLGDMPWITAAHIDQLISNFDPAKGHAVCVPTFDGKRGNPVLWAKCFFPEISEIVGDVGARHLISKHTSLVREVEMGDQAVLLDVDTAEDLTALRPPA